MTTRKGPLLSISFSPDKKYAALAASGSEIDIYEVSGNDPSKWPKVNSLVEHDQKVLSVHWGGDGKILSCGEDRQVYVWQNKKGNWKPELVQLGTRVNRAVLCCEWRSDSKAFAVGTGAKMACVCTWDETQKWWEVTGRLDHSSTVTSVRFHPDPAYKMIATTSTDQRCRIFLESQNEKGSDEYSVVFEDVSQGWIHDCQWSPGGKLIAYVSHNSTVTVVDGENGYTTQCVKSQFLPFYSLAFVRDDLIVLGCADCNLYALKFEKGEWKLVGRFAEEKKEETAKSEQAKAREMFINQATMGQKEGIAKLNSKHQNTVSCVVVVKTGEDFEVVSIAHDGTIFQWGPKHLVPL